MSVPFIHEASVCNTFPLAQHMSHFPFTVNFVSCLIALPGSSDTAPSHYALSLPLSAAAHWEGNKWTLSQNEVHGCEQARMSCHVGPTLRRAEYPVVVYSVPVTTGKAFI